MGDIDQIRDTTKFNYEHDGIYVFKPHPHRFLSLFIEGKKIIPLRSKNRNCQS